jgi:hypothetical protein
VTITADGGNMCANRGSQFAKSYGDEPGTLGGIISGTNMAEATWLSWSPDVLLEGRNACRLTDKMLMNHGNTACLAGEKQAFIRADAEEEGEKLCEIICECDENPVAGPNGTNLKQECVKKKLDQLDTPPGSSEMKAEISYDMTNYPPTPFMHRGIFGDDTLARSTHWQTRAEQKFGKAYGGQGYVRRPDVVIVKDKLTPPYQDNLKAVVEIKFDEPRDFKQIEAYEEIAGNAEVIELDPQKCGCRDNDDFKRKIEIPEPGPLYYLMMFLMMLSSLFGNPGAA